MPKKPAPDPAAPIRQDELGDFLLWFFTHTGHADHVNTWRKASQGAGADAGDDQGADKT